MKNLFKTTVMLLVLTSSIFAEEKSTEETDPSNWEKIKEEAKAHLATALAVSKEKWEQLHSFSLEEWKDSAKKIKQIKEDATYFKDKVTPEIEKLVQEIDELQSQAGEKLKAFSEASGEKADEAKEQAEKSWKALEKKIEELREKLDKSV